jgi:hypothetical protein
VDGAITAVIVGPAIVKAGTRNMKQAIRNALGALVLRAVDVIFSLL